MPRSPAALRPLFCALAVPVMLSAAACAGGPRAEPALAPSWTAETPPEEIALGIRDACRRVATDRAACYERRLIAALEVVGVGSAVRALDHLVALDPTLTADGHAIAHGLGIAAYRSPQTLAETFAACPPTQMAGCYHGVIQGYFLAIEPAGGTPGAALLDVVCEPHRQANTLYFQCAHGLGHGVMALAGHDLGRALAICDRLSDGFVREHCYGGVFMENIVHVTHPHHTAAAHAGHGGSAHVAHSAQGASTAHSDHEAHQYHEAHEHDAAHDGHGQHPTDESATAVGRIGPLDRRKPLHPCTAVAERYQRQCYLNQTSAILYFNFGDVAATARACEGAPPGMIEVCRESLGRDVVGLAGRRHDRALSLCAHTGAAEAGCLRGAAQALVNVAADAGEGLRFCAGVAAVEQRQECYRAVAVLLPDLEPEETRREALCASLDEPFAATCRRHARLPEPVS